MGPPLIGSPGQVESIAFGFAEYLFPTDMLFAANGQSIDVWDLGSDPPATALYQYALMVEGYAIRKVAVSRGNRLIAGGAYFSDDGPGVLLWKRQ